jgi:hypothetical protein
MILSTKSLTKAASMAVVFLVGFAARHLRDSIQPCPASPEFVHKKAIFPTLPDTLPFDRNISKTAVIVTLVTNETNDLHELCDALVSLVHLPDMQDDTRPLAGVIVFNEGNLLYRQKMLLERCTLRPITFTLIDFHTFPKGFDPQNETVSWGRREAYNKWGYHQMIRFFVTRICDHDAVQTYETVMRLDTDSCWTETPPDSALPELPSEYIYQHNVGTMVDTAAFCDGIYDLAKNYIERHNISVANPSLWQEFEAEWKNHKQCQIFYNNFEVARISFMQQPQVRDWHEHVTEYEPFLVFHVRLGDAVIRRVTMAMFVTPEQLLGPPKGYTHVCQNRNAFRNNFLQQIART